MGSRCVELVVAGGIQKRDFVGCVAVDCDGIETAARQIEVAIRQHDRVGDQVDVVTSGFQVECQVIVSAKTVDEHARDLVGRELVIRFRNCDSQLVAISVVLHTDVVVAIGAVNLQVPIDQRDLIDQLQIEVGILPHNFNEVLLAISSPRVGTQPVAGIR